MNYTLSKLMVSAVSLLSLLLPPNLSAQIAPAVVAGPVPPVPVENSRHTDGRTTWKQVFPAPEKFSGTGADLAAAYLQAHAEDYGIAATLADLQLVSTQASLIGSHFRYQQTLNGVPVAGADLVVSIRRDNGTVYQVYNNTYPVTAPTPAAQTVIGTEAALDAAWNHLRVHGSLMDLPGAQLVYLPVKGGFQLAYQTYVATAAPFGYWEHMINSESGEVISVRDTAVCGNQPGGAGPDFAAYTGPVSSRATATQAWQTAHPVSQTPAALNKTVVDGTAYVFDGDPRTYLANAALLDSSAASAFSAAYVPRVLHQISESNGVYRLEGPWVYLLDFEAPTDPPSTTANGLWNFPRGNNAFDDAMVYFHIDQSQRYIQSLGFLNIQYNSIGADSDGLSGADNSHYIPASNRLAFGHGGVDDDEDADVILHEYGHAITQSIVPTWSGGDSGAIGEGFGDYWGASYDATVTNGLAFHPEWAFSWDGHSADTWTGRFLDLTNLTYDHTHTYAAHETISSIANYGDQLWSAPLCQSFKTLLAQGYPRSDMDKIALQSQFGIGSGVKMRDLANAIVNTANLLFPAGPHASVYRQKFISQLIILPGAVSNAVWTIPAGGENYSTGAVVQLQWNRNGAPSTAAARLQYSTGAVNAFSDTMESGVNGWVVSHGSGSVDWSQVTTSSHSSSHSWLATDLTTVSDQYLRSPLIAVPAGGILTFWHSYSLESGYDGGVVEASLNGTTWIDIGTNATSGGYNSTISSSYSSPIAGRAAFSGNSSGFVQTQIPLTAFAGQNIYIRFRQADDSSAAVTGWYVDDVTVGTQWITLATTATNASTYSWTLPMTPATNCMVRLQQFAAGYSDSAWVPSAAFAITTPTNPPVTAITLASLTMLAGGSIQFAFTNVPGASFTVLTSSNLLLPLAGWTVLGAATESPAGQFQFTDPQAVTNPARYYRVRSP